MDKLLNNDVINAKIVYIYQIWKHKGGDVSNLLVRTSQPDSVISMVCSNWADLWPSAVTAVQSSFQRRSLYVPWFIIGSIVKICPSLINPVLLLFLINQILVKFII